MGFKKCWRNVPTTFFQTKTSISCNENKFWFAKNIYRNQKAISNLLDKFLRNAGNSSPGLRLRVDFLKGMGTSQLPGFFTETRLTGILEESDYDSTALVSPFLVAFTDTCRDMCGTARITRAYTLHGYLHFGSKERKWQVGRRNWKGHWKPS